MRSKHYIVYLLIFFLSQSVVRAQQIPPQELSAKTDEELMRMWDQVRPDTLKQEQVARLYLDRAKTAKDTVKMARAYARLASTFGPEKNLAFADSLIHLTINSEHIAYPAVGYMQKAFEYNRLDSTQQVYDNLLMADRISRERQNVSQQMYVSGRIVMLQAQWGNKQKALEKQLENHSWFVHPDFDELFRRSTRVELHDRLDALKNTVRVGSYRNFVYCYYQLGEMEKANDYLDSIDVVLAAVMQQPPGVQQMFFEHSTWAENAHIEMKLRSGSFQEAAIEADQVLQQRQAVGIPFGLKNLYFVKGIALIEVGEEDQGLVALQKADSLSRIGSYEIDYAEDKELYTALYTQYQKREMLMEAIASLDKVIELENRKNEKYAFLEPALIEEFETPILMEEKEAMIQKLSSQNESLSFWQWVMGGLLVLSLLWGLNYYRRQRQYKKRFEKLMQPASEPEKAASKTPLTSEREQKIVDALEQFEASEGFRDKDLNLNKMAKKLKTNSNYLSKVINLQFEKNLSQYLHDLRVEYAKDRLLHDPKFRLYTVKAIAEESGYRNVESFSLAFYKRHGIYPSYYIRQLNKQQA